MNFGKNIPWKPLALLALAGCAGSADLAPELGVESAKAAKTAVDDINVALADAGAAFRVYTAEYVTAPESEKAGGRIVASDRGDKHLGFQFNSEATLTPGAISYAIDSQLTADADASDVEAALDGSMAAWNDETCSDPGIYRITGTEDYDLGYVQWAYYGGGYPAYVAEVLHAGFLGGDFFDLLAEGGSGFILGVTFTFIYIDGDGNPVDGDGDGNLDAAFREIYYNDAFNWSVDGPGPGTGLYDIQTVATHEVGHGLSQGHFGRVFFDGGGKDGLDGVHFAPEAVMNAVVFGTKRDLLGSDRAGHCSYWGDWGL